MRHSQDKVIKKLENEIVSLDKDYVALLRKKWLMEDEMRRNKAQIDLIERELRSENEKRSVWQKIALILAASWAVFLSFWGVEQK